MTETIEHIVVSPNKKRHETPIFLQHGSWHGASCWKHVQPCLADLGYEVHAISLPGHGNSSLQKASINDYGFEDYLDCLAAEIGKLGRPPVLVGHSLGGLLCMKYLESHRLPGAVLLASVPHTGMARFLLKLFRKAPGSLLRQLALGDGSIKDPALSRALFFGENTQLDLNEFHHELSAESMRVSQQILLQVRVHPEKIQTPTLVVAGQKDAAFSTEEELHLAEFLGAKFVLMANMAHDLMLEPGWQGIAGEIDRFISDDLKLP